MPDTDIIIKGIRQEAAKYTLDVESEKIDLPAKYNAWRERLTLKFESSGQKVEPTLLLDKGTKPKSLEIKAQVSQAGIYISDTAKTEPDAPHANLQICRLQTDRFGRLTKVTLSVGKEEFFEYMRQLAPHSSLFQRLAALKLPDNFPDGRPDFSYFAAHADVLMEESLRLSGRLPDNK